MQALYQWDLSGSNLPDIERQFLEEEDFSRADGDYFRELLHQVPARLDEVEQAFAGYLDRPLAEIDPVERALLRMATYE
ncbi:MAG TPA: N utilization substance protein B, partial [Gammaproteobacteria bacterium]|nr:N utilization substance protein B [Gammaproteobacteria bacterium]